MANIDDKINNIRQAVLGKDVRGSLADGLDAVNKETEDITNKQQHLESTFNQLVINAGTSNSEVVDARVDKNNNNSYAKLGDRLDAHSVQMEEIKQLTNMTLFFNVTGKEGTDFSSKMKSIIDYARLNSLKKLTFPKGEYLFTKRVYFDVDDLEIDFQGSLIKWNGIIEESEWTTQQNLRIHGMFNIMGTLDETKFSNVTSLHKQSLTIGYNGLCDNFVVGVESVSNFKVGDFVRVDINGGHNDSTTTSRYAEFNQLCRILYVNNIQKTITIDVFNDFDYSISNQNLWWNTGTYKNGAIDYPIHVEHPPSKNGKVWVVNPVKNFVLKNFIFDDIQKYDEGVTQIGSCVCGISTINTYNLKIENVIASHMKFPLILNRLCQSGSFKDIYGKDADVITAGRGYVIQSVHCNNIEYNNIVGSNVRHTVDFSGVINGKMINCHDYNNIRDNSGIAIHGMCEYNITIENCSANRISLGHGTPFPCMSDRFLIRNCKFDIQTFNDVNNTNFTFEDCTLGHYNQFASFGDSIFNRCDFKYNNTFNILYWDMKKRGIEKEYYLNFYNCNIDYSKQTRVYYLWQNKLKFKNSDIIYPGVIIIDGVNIISYFENNLSFSFPVKFYVSSRELSSTNNNSLKIIDFEFNSNKINRGHIEQGLSRIGFNNIKDTKITSSFINNKLLYNKANVDQSTDSFTLGYISHNQSIGVDSDITDYTNAKIVSKYLNNSLESSNLNGVGHYVDTTPTAYIIKEICRNNILRCPTTFDVCDTTNNMKFSEIY